MSSRLLSPGDEPVGTVERTDPRAVLADWFDHTAESLDDLVAELVAAYEPVEDDDEGDELARTPRGDDLAEVAIVAVRRYLYNRTAKPGRTNPKQAMADWFSLPADQEQPEPFTLLTWHVPQSLGARPALNWPRTL